MMDASLAPIARWHNVYVIVGAAAGALTWLQFVVIALIPDARTKGPLDTIDSGAADGAPAALLVSSAPPGAKGRPSTAMSAR
jgi:hypothetical protein